MAELDDLNKESKEYVYEKETKETKETKGPKGTKGKSTQQKIKSLFQRLQFKADVVDKLEPGLAKDAAMYIFNIKSVYFVLDSMFLFILAFNIVTAYFLQNAILLFISISKFFYILVNELAILPLFFDLDLKGFTAVVVGFEFIVFTVSPVEYGLFLEIYLISSLSIYFYMFAIEAILEKKDDLSELDDMFEEILNMSGIKNSEDVLKRLKNNNVGKTIVEYLTLVEAKGNPLKKRYLISATYFGIGTMVAVLVYKYKLT